MKPNHRHLSLSHRLALGVLIPLSLAACAVWVAGDRSGVVHHERTEAALHDHLAATRWSQDITLDAQRERTLELEIAAAADEEQRSQLNLARDLQRRKIQAALNTPQAQATQSPAEARQIDAVRTAFVAYWSRTEAAGKAVNRAEWSRLQLALSRWQQIQDVEHHTAASAPVEAGPLGANGRTALSAFLLLCAFGTGLVMLRTSVRSVRSPLNEARLAIEALSSGDYQRRVHIERLDEAGDVLVALDDLSNYLAVMLPDDEMAMDASFDHIVDQLRTSDANCRMDIVDTTPVPASPQTHKAAHVPTLAMGTTARA